MDEIQLWQRYQRFLCECPSVGLKLDVSRMGFDEGFFERMTPLCERAFGAMEQLERGDIANPDEQRMVGHYWLRQPSLAPTPELRGEVESTLLAIKAFAQDVHGGTIKPPTAVRFTDLLLIGIGGSALGPQLVADALSGLRGRDKMRLHLLDNTDPDGIARTLGALGGRAKSTLVLVVSKSGGTPETRNGMLEAQAHFARRKLDFARHAAAVTSAGSRLDQLAAAEHWLARFPMWDWVGGRTSVTSAVGLLPMALLGLDIDGFLAGAAAMDSLTRPRDPRTNPAMLLALMWHYGTDGRGSRDMVVLPYKDRLLLLSRYLQQLVMESLGKEKDLSGNVVHQGIAVYGNKGSTDQHAYVQQLREGVANFFATFIVVLRDSTRKLNLEVDPGVTSGDYLNGFWQGTRSALHSNGRGSITITVDKLDAHRLGALVALHERAVGFYATMVNINAYHQPGVEAGKKAAAAVLDLQARVVAHMRTLSAPAAAEEIASGLGQPQHAETVFHILEHLAANQRGVKRSGMKFRLTAVK